MKNPRLAKKLVAAVAVVGVAVSLAACSPSSPAAKGSSLILNVAGQSDNLTQVFNPFLPNTAEGLTFASQGQGGFIYEPLVQINTVDIGKDIPWLAKSWVWSNGNKTLTLKLQSGVKWSDGKAFSADDVVFTYNLIKKYPALNLLGVQFDSISASDPNTVVMNFADPSQTLFTNIVSVPIVSQHIWSKVSDPTTYTDKNPVGTGAFELSTFSPQSFVLKKNPHYWNGEPKIAGIRFVAYKDNQSQTEALVQGQADWGGTYIANAKATYTSRAKTNHYWAPIAGVDGMIPNLTRWPLSDLAVRQAISLGVNRTQIGAASDSPPATSVTGLPMPSYESSISAALKGVNYTQDVAGAKAKLEGDGFTMGSDGYYTKGGKRLETSISFPAAYTDIAGRVQVMVSQFKDFGMKLDVDTTSVNDINKITANGNFDSTQGYPVNSAPRAFSFYNDTINPNLYYPIGKATPTYQNIERFQNADAAQLFKEYPAATTDADRQKILDQLEKIFADNLPWIPMFYWGSYGNWSTAKVTGFPTPSDPYFTPVPNEVVALRLTPVK
ncbi:MAG TPA: ABC transporter substrate-binding protein [Galbitalea sp.]